MSTFMADRRGFLKGVFLLVPSISAFLEACESKRSQMMETPGIEKESIVKLAKGVPPIDAQQPATVEMATFALG